MIPGRSEGDLGGRMGARTKSILPDLEPRKEVEEGP